MWRCLGISFSTLTWPLVGWSSASGLPTTTLPLPPSSRCAFEITGLSVPILVGALSLGATSTLGEVGCQVGD